MSFRFQVLSFKFQDRGPQSKGQSPKSLRNNRGSFVLVLCSLLSVSISVSVLSACGKKTPVRPPELVAPEPIGDLTLEIEDKGIKLRWGRTQTTVDGSDLDDLGGFVVLRATQDAQGSSSVFTQLATIPVEDQDRFRKTKKFSYTDEELTAGTLYRYRVRAFTLDGYYSTPSNTVELVWKGGP